MEHLTRTPFGRPVSAGLLAHQALVETDEAVEPQEKWQMFRTICTARTVFGLTDRDLTVLNALISFYPNSELQDGPALIVFPSNASLAERAHGMAESTLRRHLAALVRVGVILRHDSPNGKRYAARGRDGTVTHAFGFDLRPLLHRANEFADAAEEVKQAQEALRRAREVCVLKLRDCTKLAAYGREEGLPARWDAIEDGARLCRRALRRKLGMEELADLSEELSALLQQTLAAFPPNQTQEKSGNDGQNERHYQNSKPDSFESEPCLENQEGQGEQSDERTLPLAVVVKACPDLQDYVQDPIRHWHQLVVAADMLRGMMGISPDAWDEACEIMGRDRAAIVVACMLQRMAQINSPGGYIRSLTTKARAGAFSPGPMVMALLNTTNATAA